MRRTVVCNRVTSRVTRQLKEAYKLDQFDGAACRLSQEHNLMHDKIAATGNVRSRANTEYCNKDVQMRIHRRVGTVRSCRNTHTQGHYRTDLQLLLSKQDVWTLKSGGNYYYLNGINSIDPYHSTHIDVKQRTSAVIGRKAARVYQSKC